MKLERQFLTRTMMYISLTFLMVLTLNTINAQVVTTFAGDGTVGSTDGTGTAASFYYPRYAVVDASGNLYVVDTYNNLIRKITPAAVVTTFAGSGAYGSTDATGTAASFGSPHGIAIDASGNLYIADTGNNKIRKITPAGVVTTFAGSGVSGSTDATGTAASFTWPWGVAVDATGNVYIADSFNQKIRKITPAGVVTTFAGSGTAGALDGTGTAARFNAPAGLAIDASGNLYVADASNHKIRKITSAGVVSTIAGSGTIGSADGTGTAASFNAPFDVAADASGNLYVTDRDNHKIRKITPAGVVTTLAGTGTAGSTNGTGTSASFNAPHGLAVDATGNLYIADSDNNLIRKITLNTTAVDNSFAKLALSLYPNPTSGDLLIDAPENIQITLYNAQGVKVLEQTLSEGNNVLSIEHLNAGLYTLHYSNGTSKSQQQKIIKN